MKATKHESMGIRPTIRNVPSALSIGEAADIVRWWIKQEHICGSDCPCQQANKMMKYSKHGLQLTESFEGCRLKAYLDQRGVLTIGYGHTIGVHVGMTCTEEMADQWLADDVLWAEATVNAYAKIALSQGEFDALVDFVFNVGSGNFVHSTLLKLVNSGNFVTAAIEFEKWKYCGGVEVAGLLRRRLAEKAMFVEMV